jgi:hypothetical protein
MPTAVSEMDGDATFMSLSLGKKDPSRIQVLAPSSFITSEREKEKGIGRGASRAKRMNEGG